MINSTQIEIGTRALTEFVIKQQIHRIYIAVRDNYVIINPTKLAPSRNSYISKLWINHKKMKDKILFFIPEIKDIKYDQDYNNGEEKSSPFFV